MEDYVCNCGDACTQGTSHNIRRGGMRPLVDGASVQANDHGRRDGSRRQIHAEQLVSDQLDFLTRLPFTDTKAKGALGGMLYSLIVSYARPQHSEHIHSPGAW